MEARNYRTHCHTSPEWSAINPDDRSKMIARCWCSTHKQWEWVWLCTGIEHGIPLPGFRQADFEIDYRAMQIGDSFFLPPTATISRNGMLTRIARDPQTADWKMQTAKEGKGYRFWRIA